MKDKMLVLFGLLMVIGAVNAADETIVVNSSSYISWEVRNASDADAPITDALCNLTAWYNNGTLLFRNISNSFSSGATYIAQTNSSWTLGNYYCLAACTKNSQWANVSFTVEVVNTIANINITGFVTAAGGGGTSNEVFIFIAILIICVWVAVKYYLPEKQVILSKNQ